MLARQAELSLLNGDFHHFDESGSHDLSPDKEVSCPNLHFIMIIIVKSSC